MHGAILRHRYFIYEGMIFQIKEIYCFYFSLQQPDSYLINHGPSSPLKFNPLTSIKNVGEFVDISYRALTVGL